MDPYIQIETQKERHILQDEFPVKLLYQVCFKR